MESILREARYTLGSVRPAPLQALFREALVGTDVGSLFHSGWRLQLAPRGDGHAVMVLPGYGASERSTHWMRLFLRKKSYRALDWELGINDGNLTRQTPLVIQRIRDIVAQGGGRVSLIGWSMGGVLARAVAATIPSAVRQVITLGSPLIGGGYHTIFGEAYDRATAAGATIEYPDWTRTIPSDVPLTVVYSRRDGIVAWQACIDQRNPHAKHVEVASSHIGLAYNAQVYHTIARQLARPDRSPDLL